MIYAKAFGLATMAHLGGWSIAAVIIGHYPPFSWGLQVLYVSVGLLIAAFGRPA